MSFESLASQLDFNPPDILAILDTPDIQEPELAAFDDFFGLVVDPNPVAGLLRADVIGFQDAAI